MALVLALALLSSLAVGYFVAQWLLPVYAPRWADLAFKVSLGAGFGAGVSSCLYFLVWLVAGPSIKLYVLAELAVLGAVIFACWRTRPAPVVESPLAKPMGWSWLLLPGVLVALALAISLFAETSASSPYGEWDAWGIWNLRAKFIAQQNASWKSAFTPVLNVLAGGGATHPDYPLLVSGYVGRCWSLMGSSEDVSAPIAVAALFALATVGLMVSGLALLRGWTAAMLGGLILLGTAGFQLEIPWQYADVPIGFYYLAFFVLLFLADAGGADRGWTLALAGLAMGFAAWTKNEGLLFTLLAGAGFVAYVWRSAPAARFRMFGVFAAGAAAPLAIALYFKIFIAPATGTFAPVTLASVAHKLTELPRYKLIVKAFWDEGLALGSGVAHPAVCLAALGGCLGIPRERMRQPVVLASLATAVALIAGYFLTYVVTPLDLAWHLGTSLGRLYQQIWPSLVFLSLAVMRPAEDTLIAIPPLQAARAPGKESSTRKRRHGIK